MKKLMSILSSLSIITAGASSIIACSTKGDTIAFVTPETTNEYFDGLEQAAVDYVKEKYENKYKVKTYRSNNKIEDEKSNMENALASGAKGIMFVPVQTDNSPGAKEVIKDDKVPLAAVDRVLSAEANIKVDSSFYTDGALASKTMAEELYKLMTENRSDIKYGQQIDTIYIRGDLAADSTKSRYKGFMEDAVFTKEMIEEIKEGDPKPNLGDKLFKFPNGVDASQWVGKTFEFTEGLNLVTAKPQDVQKAKLIVSMNDPMALGAIQGIKTTDGLKELVSPKPGDGIGLIVVGFDANDSARKQIEKWVDDKLNMFASVAQDPKGMAEQAVKFIIEEIENERKNKQSDKKIPIATKNIIGLKKN